MMEELVGPQVEVVLTLKEVTDLTFVNGPVFAMAKFSENQMETDVLEAEKIVAFNTDLIWETNKQNIKKMRNCNIPIKLFICKYISEKQHEKIGYVVVNLRTAQYVPKGKIVSIKEEHVKVLGLGKEAKGCSPLMHFSLSIRDKPPEPGSVTRPENVNLNESRMENCNSYGDAGGGIESVIDVLPVKDLPAPEEMPAINEMGDVREMVSQIPPLNAEAFHSPPPPPPPPLPPASRSPRTKLSITSKLGEDRRQFINGYDAKNSSGDLQPQKRFVEAYRNFKLKIQLDSVVWYSVPQKFRFRFQHSRCEIFSTAHPEIEVARANETIELCDIKATFNFVETPAEFYKLLNDVPPTVSVCCYQQNRHVVITRESLRTDRLAATEEEKVYSIDLTDVKTRETIGKLTYAASLTDCGPQVMKDVTLKLKSQSEKDDLPPGFFGSVTDKVVDELEDWKEQQKQLFQQEFTKKLQNEISVLREEWMGRRREQEEKLNQRMEQCRMLGNSLIIATEDVKQKNQELLEKEKHLEATKNELELRYLKLLTDKNDEAEKLKEEYAACLVENEKKMDSWEAEKTALHAQIKVLQKENEELKAALKENESEIEKNKRGCLSQEQTATLLQDLKTMQEKMEAANNSKLFFKEQWGRAVREIHRIKSEYTKNIKVQLQYRKDELKKLGLEQLYLLEKNKNNLDRDDILEAKDFLGPDFDAKNPRRGEMDFLTGSKSNYDMFKTNMEIVKESNTYLLKFNQESEEKLKKLIEERDKLLCEDNCPIDDDRVVKLNKEIRHLLDH